MATIETDLKEIFAKFDQRFDRLEQRLDRIDQRLEVLPKMEAEISQLKDDVKDIKGRANAQIWTLIVAIVGALITAVIRFGFFPNP